MRVYQFTNGSTIDVSVVTDGSDKQEQVTITETPRGISAPGEQPGNAPGNAILGMGFDFEAGTMRYHQDFISFAQKNNLKLTQWNEGFKGISVVLVPGS